MSNAVFPLAILCETRDILVTETSEYFGNPATGLRVVRLSTECSHPSLKPHSRATPQPEHLLTRQVLPATAFNYRW